MIAFIKPPESTVASPAIRHVHQVIAKTLIPTEPAEQKPPTFNRKARFVAAWLVAAATVAVVHTIYILL